MNRIKAGGLLGLLIVVWTLVANAQSTQQAAAPEKSAFAKIATCNLKTEPTAREYGQVYTGYSAYRDCGYSYGSNCHEHGNRKYQGFTLRTKTDEEVLVERCQRYSQCMVSVTDGAVNIENDADYQAARTYVARLQEVYSSLGCESAKKKKRR